MLFKAYFQSPKFLFRGIIGYVAYIWIFPPWFAAWLHKCRGVNIRDVRTVYIAPNVLIDTNFPERLTIGNFVYITRGAKILCHTAYTPLTQEIVGVDCVIGPVTIDDGAYIGVNAVVLPNTRIGRCAVIGAGAIVTQDIPDYAIAVGVPARVIGDVRDLAAKST
jgi:acetyltransferase-like isoleucine patch superfamily enzyme